MLELRSLRHFLVLSRRLNYGRAAEELGITQPSLTRSIQALERQLGLQLFDRDRGGVQLTPQGRTIAERAAFLLTDAEDLERHSKLYGHGESGHIRFGMAPMPARALLNGVLVDRLKAAPNVINEVVVRDVEALWDMLVRGELEFFVSQDSALHDLSQAHVELLGVFPFSLIVRAGHPLMRGASADQYPLLRSSWTGLPIPAEIERYVGGDPNIIEDFATLAEVAASTDALWLSSAFAVRREIADGKLSELFRASQTINVSLFSMKRRAQSPLAESAMAAVRRQVRDLVSAQDQQPDRRPQRGRDHSRRRR